MAILLRIEALFILVLVPGYVEQMNFEVNSSYSMQLPFILSHLLDLFHCSNYVLPRSGLSLLFSRKVSMALLLCSHWPCFVAVSETPVDSASQSPSHAPAVARVDETMHD